MKYNLIEKKYHIKKRNRLKAKRVRDRKLSMQGKESKEQIEGLESKGTTGKEFMQG